MSNCANLLDDYGPTMYRTAFRLLGRSEDAEDCVHDVFLEVMNMADHSHIQTWPAFLSWMTTIRSLDRLRQSRQLPVYESAEIEQLAAYKEDGPERAELLAWLRCAIASLPTRRREVFSLRYFADLSYDQISEVLGMEVPTVGVTLREARLQLRKYMSPNSKHGLNKGASL